MSLPRGIDIQNALLFVSEDEFQACRQWLKTRGLIRILVSSRPNRSRAAGENGLSDNQADANLRR
jgi:hypothetical protein